MTVHQVPGLMRIPGRYAITLVIRGMAIWVVSRLMVVVLYMFVGDNLGRDQETVSAFTQGNPLILAIWTMVVSVALLVFDLHRRHEVTLLNNLGVITAHAVMLGAVPALMMEITMAIL